MKALYKLNFDCGRNGSLEGIFTAEKEDVEVLVEKEIPIYFGEVLGKHSEVYGTVERDEIEFITDAEEVINIFEKYKLSSGYNPFDYSVKSGFFEEDDVTVKEAIARFKGGKI